jgi:heme exporter protein A
MAAPLPPAAGIRHLESALQTCLAVRQLELTRGDRCLFSGLDFDLGRGELALVTGANGAGKTTLLRTLAGLREPAAGSIAMDGQLLGSAVTQGLARLAYQGHLDGLKRDLTVAENLSFYAALWGSPERPEDLVAELGLDRCLSLQVRDLSAGQRRRAALGCLRLRAATLWLLDEPLTNLDTRGAELVASWLDRHLVQGGAAVVASHQTDRLAERAALRIEL